MGPPVRHELGTTSVAPTGPREQLTGGLGGEDGVGSPGVPHRSEVRQTRLTERERKGDAERQPVLDELTAEAQKRGLGY